RRPWTKLDDLHRESLDKLLVQFGIKGLSAAEIDHFNRAWHRLDPWPDSVPGLTRLKKKFVLATLSNGNVALIVNMAKYGGAPVGRGPRGRGGASLQASARVLPDDRGAAGPGARRVHDGRRAQRRPRQGQRGRAADRVRAAAERARTGLEPRRHPSAPVGRRREGLPGPGRAAWLRIRSSHMAKITQSVDLSTRGRVAVLTVDNPPVNALSRHVRKGLHDGIKQAIADAAVQAIVIACAGRTFIAGADITEFGKPPAEPSLHSVLDLIEGSPKPVVAAVHGTALGGGLEVTLACHYRVGVKAARFGLPEVKLGILPGAGGTQRLPRVVGVEKGLSMMV